MSVCAKFQLSSWSRSGLKVPGGVVGCSGVGCSGVWCSGVWWLRPILVFSLSLGQAEQKAKKFFAIMTKWDIFAQNLLPVQIFSGN